MQNEMQLVGLYDAGHRVLAADDKWLFFYAQIFIGNERCGVMLTTIQMAHLKTVRALVVTMRKPFTRGQYMRKSMFHHIAADLAVCPSKWQA